MRLDLVLVGFGNVARRFVRLAQEMAGPLGCDHDLTLRVCGIVTARRGATFDEAGVDAVAAADALDAGGTLGEPGPARDVIARSAALGTTRVLVETTPLNVHTGQPAIDHIRAALNAGLHVVTANKGPVAIAWGELDRLARERGVLFLFEGAVMDGIPIFNLVRETMPGVRITGFRGVVNSTTNHILTMMEDGGEFGPALEEMQRAGIAEADPALDVDGWDAAAKTAALANVLMHAALTPADVDRIGIRDITGANVRNAVAQGRRIRLVASFRDGRARAGPEELPAGDPLAQLRGMQNAIIFGTDLLGNVAVTQLAGGLTQTAYALVSDLVTVARRIRSDGGAPAR
ncbi:MAG: homoserine dehydrogenase [Vicinamibacterales bacterium]